MNARNAIKRTSYLNLDARAVLAAVRLRFAAQVDFIVARWIERCAANVEAGQWLFKAGRKPTRGFATSVGLAISSPRWDEAS